MSGSIWSTSCQRWQIGLLYFGGEVSACCTLEVRYRYTSGGNSRGANGWKTLGTPVWAPPSWSVAVGLQNVSPFVTERIQALSRDPGVLAAYHARIVRAVRIGVHDYMQRVATNIAHGAEGVDIPDYAIMLQDLKSGTFHNSTNWVEIPDAYLNAPQVITVQRTASATPSVAATSPPTRLQCIDNLARDAEFYGITLRAGGCATDYYVSTDLLPTTPEPSSASRGGPEEGVSRTADGEPRTPPSHPPRNAPAASHT